IDVEKLNSINSKCSFNINDHYYHGIGDDKLPRRAKNAVIKRQKIRKKREPLMKGVMMECIRQRTKKLKMCTTSNEAHGKIEFGG
ncbi:23656_t:CDS:1, partial [Dentiscutata erythropus]